MAAGQNQVPERLINFRVYNDSDDLIGIATVDMPEIQAMTDTVSGAGIAGEVETPVLGHYQAMTVTLNWRTVEKKAVELAAQKAHAVEVRGSQQIYDAANGEYSTVPVRAVMRLVPRNLSVGSFEPGSGTDTSTEFSVLYIKIFIDGKEVLEVDPFNYVAKFGDTDILESVRSDLGLA